MMQKGSLWKYLLIAFVSGSTLRVILRRKPFSKKIGLKVKFNIGISQKFLIFEKYSKKAFTQGIFENIKVDFSLQPN